MACSAIMIVPSHVLFAKKEVRDRKGELVRYGSVVPSDKINSACYGIGNQDSLDMNIMYNKDFINGQWHCWYDFGMGALGDWDAQIIDSTNQFLKPGLSIEIDPLKLRRDNPFFFPMASTILFRLPERNSMPPCDITWHDGVNNIPEVTEGYGVSELDPNIPPTSVGKIRSSTLNPGKIIYSKELAFKGAFHGKTLSIIPEDRAKEMEHLLLEIPERIPNHWANFFKAVKRESPLIN